MNEFSCNDSKVIFFRISLHSFKLFQAIDCLEIHQFPKETLVLKWKHLQKAYIILKWISEARWTYRQILLILQKILWYKIKVNEVCLQRFWYLTNKNSSNFTYYNALLYIPHFNFIIQIGPESNTPTTPSQERDHLESFCWKEMSIL